MRIAGKRVKRTKLVRSDRYVVAVEVELVIPRDDPSEACYETETLDFLEQVKRRADSNDRTWLRKQGMVYELVSAARGNILKNKPARMKSRLAKRLNKPAAAK